LLTIYICIRLDALDGQTDGKGKKYRSTQAVSKFVENFISLLNYNVYFIAKIIECPTRKPIAFAVLLTCNWCRHWR